MEKLYGPLWSVWFLWFIWFVSFSGVCGPTKKPGKLEKPDRLNRTDRPQTDKTSIADSDLADPPGRDDFSCAGDAEGVEDSGLRVDIDS